MVIDDRTPDHSVLSKARRRWGQNAFSEFFAAILQQCVDVGLVDSTTIHDANNKFMKKYDSAIPI
jgi:hypothetical protein